MKRGYQYSVIRTMCVCGVGWSGVGWGETAQQMVLRTQKYSSRLPRTQPCISVTLYLQACQATGTIDDSDLCRCVSCYVSDVCPTLLITLLLILFL